MDAIERYEMLSRRKEEVSSNIISLIMSFLKDIEKLSSIEKEIQDIEKESIKLRIKEWKDV